MFQQLKPLDEKTILQSINKTGAVLTVVENHSIIGGLAVRYAKLLAENLSVPVQKSRCKR